MLVRVENKMKIWAEEINKSLEIEISTAFRQLKDSLPNSTLGATFSNGTENAELCFCGIYSAITKIGHSSRELSQTMKKNESVMITFDANEAGNQFVNV